MIFLIDIVLAAFALILFGLAAFLAVEVLAGVSAGMPAASLPSSLPRPSVCVLIPAHNEEAAIGQTIDGVRSQLGPSDRLLIVADNCDDATAEVARRQGAEAIERHDLANRGKGYALDFGLRHLAQDPPGIVVILDADCTLSAGALDVLASEAATRNRPVQALYSMRMPIDAPPHRKLAAFAFLLRSLVRPRGMQRLGLPCPLKGTGMAFPWAVISQASLASGHIVEDVKLGIDLAIAGHNPWFEPRAEVWSDFPASPQAEATQRRRWEHGHLSSILSDAPRLLVESVRQRRLDLAGAALDLAVPPLALFGLLLAGVFLVTLVFTLSGGDPSSLIISCAALALAALSLTVAWAAHGRSIVTAGELIAVIPYALRKIPLYLDFLSKRESQWIRTARDGEDSKK